LKANIAKLIKKQPKRLQSIKIQGLKDGSVFARASLTANGAAT